MAGGGYGGYARPPWCVGPPASKAAKWILILEERVANSNSNNNLSTFYHLLEQIYDNNNSSDCENIKLRYHVF